MGCVTRVRWRCIVFALAVDDAIHQPKPSTSHLYVVLVLARVVGNANEGSTSVLVPSTILVVCWSVGEWEYCEYVAMALMGMAYACCGGYPIKFTGLMSPCCVKMGGLVFTNILGCWGTDCADCPDCPDCPDSLLACLIFHAVRAATNRIKAPDPDRMAIIVVLRTNLDPRQGWRSVSGCCP